MQTQDAYKHFDDSIAAICDFDRRDYLYEVPYRTLTKKGFPNLITAGRCGSSRLCMGCAKGNSTGHPYRTGSWCGMCHGTG